MRRVSNVGTLWVDGIGEARCSSTKGQVEDGEEDG